MQNVHFNAPAFPPQVAQDPLGRIIAPIPGMSKLEYFTGQLLPFYLQLATTKKLSDKGEPITAVDAAIKTAKELLTKLNTNDNESNTTHDIKQP